MPHFMIVLTLYINLLNPSWIKMSIFVEYGAFNYEGIASPSQSQEIQTVQFFFKKEKKTTSFISKETNQLV